MQEKLDSSKPLEAHPLEQYCLPDKLLLPEIEETNSDSLAKLLEVYMDDFISLAQSMSKE